MNIFFSSLDPDVAARALENRHVVKMMTETAQILSTVLRAKGVDDDRLCKPSHAAHPCVIWAGQSRGNFDWTLAHGSALVEEYRRRYGKTSQVVERYAAIRACAGAAAFDAADFTPPPRCVLDEFKGLPLTLAYRSALARKYRTWATTPDARGKIHRPDWKGTAPPAWLDPETFDLRAENTL